MSSGIFGNTLNYKFNLIQFDFATWHTLEYENWQSLDAILGTYIGVGNVQGVWNNSTAYAVGARVADDANGSLYQCLIAHTSPAAPTTFAQDRSANPTRWDLITLAPQFRGEWATGTLYNNNDFVAFTGTGGPIYAIANTSHTAGATFAGDSSRWDYLVDVSDFPTAADRVLKTGDTMTGDLLLRRASGNGTINIDTATGQDAILALTEINSQFGHRFRHDGTENRLYLESTANSFSSSTVVFTTARGSNIVDFKGVPTVNAANLLTNASADTQYLQLSGGTLTGNLNINNSAPALQLGSSTLSTGDAAIEVGTGRTGNGFAFIDLIGDTVYTDFGLRLIRRNTGQNADSQLIHRGTGPLQIVTDEAGDIQFVTNSITRGTFSGTDGIFNAVNGITVGGTNLTALYAPLAHVGSGGTAHADVVAGGADGFMTGADKSKLDSVQAGAQVNAVTTVNGQTGAVTVSTAPIYANVWRTSDLDIDTSGSGVGGHDNIVWQAETDPSGLISVPSHIFTMPTGATLVQIYGQILWDATGPAAVGDGELRAYVNGTQIYFNLVEMRGDDVVRMDFITPVTATAAGQQVLLTGRVTGEGNNPGINGSGVLNFRSQATVVVWT